MATTIPLSSLMGYLIDDLPRMIQRKTTTLEHTFQLGTTEVIRTKIELFENQIRPNCLDAAIIIDNFCHIVDGSDYLLKISIVAKQCMMNNVLNKKGPERTLEIESFTPMNHTKELDDFQKSELERTLEADVCLKWDTHVGNR